MPDAADPSPLANFRANRPATGRCGFLWSSHQPLRRIHRERPADLVHYAVVVHADLHTYPETTSAAIPMEADYPTRSSGFIHKNAG